MGSYWVGEGFLTNEMMFVVYDDDDHGSRLTRENEIQPPSESFVTGKNLEIRKELQEIRCTKGTVCTYRQLPCF